MLSVSSHVVLGLRLLVLVVDFCHHVYMSDVLRSPHKPSEPPFELVMFIRASLQLRVGYKDAQKESRAKAKGTGNTKKKPAAQQAMSESENDGSDNDEDSDGGSFESSSPPPQDRKSVV